MSHVLPYASILSIFFVALSLRTIRMRRRLKISLGDIGNTQMLRAMRVHANFAEYVPLSLLLIYLVEQQHVQSVFVHMLGIFLVFGRISHAYGLSRTKENFRFRVAGIALTFTVLLTSASYLLFAYIKSVIG